MKYEQFNPPDSLKAYIRYWWTLEDSSSVSGKSCLRTMADGCPGIIFHHSEGGTLSQNYKPLASAILYGQSTTYALIQLPDKFSAIGVSFYPNVISTIFGLKAAELTDKCVDLDLLAKRNGFDLSEQLAHATLPLDQASILFKYLLLQARMNTNSVNTPVQYALSLMLQSSHGVSLPELHKEMKLSERTFERKFIEQVGISPKLFLRICRFQSSLSQLRNKQFDKLSDIAFEQGFADQSHFIRSFWEFAGFSPNQFRKQSEAFNENFTVMI